MTGLRTALFWKNLKGRGGLCARMCWQERIVSLTILADDEAHICPANPGKPARHASRAIDLPGVPYPADPYMPVRA